MLLNTKKQNPNPNRSVVAAGLIEFRAEIKRLMRSKIWDRHEADLIADGVCRGYDAANRRIDTKLRATRYAHAMARAIPEPVIVHAQVGDDEDLGF